MTPKEDLKFADAVNRLENIVGRLEQGDIPLEESFELFEEGLALAKVCSAKLNEVEKKIEQLTKSQSEHEKTGGGGDIEQ